MSQGIARRALALAGRSGLARSAHSALARRGTLLRACVPAASQADALRSGRIGHGRLASWPRGLSTEPRGLSTEPRPLGATGQLSRVVFSAPGYMIGILNTADGSEELKFVTKTAPADLREGDDVTLFDGTWASHHKHGMQFECSVVKCAALSPPALDDADPTTDTSPAPSLSAYEPVTPLSVARDLLAFGGVKGVGPRISKDIVKAFGKDTAAVLGDAGGGAARLAEAVTGVGPKMSKLIVASWAASGYSELLPFLVRTGVAYPLEYKRLYASVTSRADEKVDDPFDPLQLRMLPVDRRHATIVAELEKRPYGFFAKSMASFAVVDRVGCAMGLHHSPQRELAACTHVMRTVTDRSGHTCVPLASLFEKTAQLLALRSAPGTRNPPGEPLDAAGFLGRLGKAREERFPLEVRELDGEAWVYPRHLFKAEEAVLGSLTRTLATDGTPAPRDEPVELTKDSRRFLSRQQQDFVKVLLTSKVSVLTGFAGTGKTYTMKAFTEELDARDKTVVLLAPTGRAAKRLAMATGCDASTIHRELGLGGEVEEAGQIFADVVIVDESSMLELPLAEKLLGAIGPRTCLVFVGDPAQLQSVGPGNFLHDLIDSGTVPVCSLTEVFRQADRNSPILANAESVRNGQSPAVLDALGPVEPAAGEAGEAAVAGQRSDQILYVSCQEEDAWATIEDRVFPRIKDNGFDLQSDVQVLSPRNTGATGCHELNPKLRTVLNDESIAVRDSSRHFDASNAEELDKEAREFCEAVGFLPGDRIVQIKNDYKRMVFNGEFGKVESVARMKSKRAGGDLVWCLKVSFEEQDNFAAGRKKAGKIDDDGGGDDDDDDDADDADTALRTYTLADADMLALAYISTVHKAQGSQFPVVVLPMFRAHGPVLTRNLVYTAMTRASHLLIVLGEASAVRTAVGSTAHHRDSLLGKLLQQRQGGPSS